MPQTLWTGIVFRAARQETGDRKQLCRSRASSHQDRLSRPALNAVASFADAGELQRWPCVA